MLKVSVGKIMNKMVFFNLEFRTCDKLQKIKLPDCVLRDQNTRYSSHSMSKASNSYTKRPGWFTSVQLCFRVFGVELLSNTDKSEKSRNHLMWFLATKVHKNLSGILLGGKKLIHKSVGRGEVRNHVFRFSVIFDVTRKTSKPGSHDQKLN